MWSGDSTTTPDELVEAVAAAGIDVVCITDHSTITGARTLEDRLGCRVVIGQEQRTPDGELIGLFLSEPVAAGLKSAAATARAIRAQGGIVYVPHPFDPMRHCLDEATLHELVGNGLVDVVEVRNAKTSLEHRNARAREFADEHGVAAGAGSDAHVPAAVGAAYVEMPDFADAAGFLDSLGSGAIVGHFFDAPRPFRSRVVPSVSRYR